MRKTLPQWYTAPSPATWSLHPGGLQPSGSPWSPSGGDTLTHHQPRKKKQPRSISIRELESRLESLLDRISGLSVDEFVVILETVLPEEYADKGAPRYSCDARPGTAQKRKRLSRRYARKLQLFHRQDPFMGPSQMIKLDHAKKAACPLPTEDPEDPEGPGAEDSYQEET